jgi:N-acetylglutamate synthase-like GNAT family acetyltransferase
MNRQQRRKVERGIKKRVEESFLGSNPSFSIMKEVLGPHEFQQESHVMVAVTNPTINKMKISPGLIFDNGIVRAVLTVEKEGLEITTVKVYPDYLSQGYGKLMLDFLLVTFQKAKVAFVSLYPQKKDPKDQVSLAKCQKTLENFYSKRGFEWNKQKTAMVMNWEKFEIYAENNQIIETLDFERILNPIGVMGLMAA